MLSIEQALKQVIRNYNTLRERWQQAMQQIEGNRLAANSLKRLQTIPGPPNHPIKWTTKKQRKAYFASNGFGRGIPSTRTGQIVSEWQGSFEATDSGGVLVLSNWNEAVQFLQGVNMQGFHRDTGWVPIDDVTDEAHDEMGEVAIFTFYQVGDPLEGVQ